MDGYVDIPSASPPLEPKVLGGEAGPRKEDGAGFVDGPSSVEPELAAEGRRVNYWLGLARRAGLTRSAPLTRTKPLRSKRPKAIPAAVTAEVRERAGDCCEFPGCGRYLGPDGGERHHRQKRSQGGKHTAGNLWLLCHQHHAEVHANQKAAVQAGLLIQKGKVA